MILFDRLINVVLRSSQDESKMFPILTPRSGVKPDISVSFSMLEAGGLAYSIQVEITNISQDVSFSVYDWDLMDVEIGYKIKDNPAGNQTLTHTMNCAIFNSYTTGPNPNSKTVFVGIVGAHMRDVFVRKPIYVVINKDKLTVKELVTTIAHVIGHEPAIPKAVEDYELFFMHNEGYSAGQVHYKAENGLALIRWLQGIAEQAGNAHNEVWTVTTYNGKLMVVGNTPIDGKEKVTAVKMDTMNSMTITGNVVDVEAPYNPLVHPGALVTINPRFYTAVLPNSETTKYINTAMDAARALITGDEPGTANLYKVLTMDVKFSTRDANVMKFKAVGGQSSYTGAKDNTNVSSSTISERAQQAALDKISKRALVLDSAAMAASAVNITGVGGSSVLESNTSIQIQFGVHVPIVRGELNTFLAMSSAFASGGQDVTVINNDATFASLAAEYYAGKVAYKDLSRTENNVNKPPMRPVPDGSGGYTNPSIPCEFFAPVIALATYAQYISKGMAGSGYADVSQCITSSIPNGSVVCIPNIPDDITSMPTWSMAFDQYASLLLSDTNAGVSEADVVNYRQIAYYMESP